MRIVCVFLAMAVGTTSFAVRADDDDLGLIRQWVDEGRILSLQDLLDMHRERFTGRLLDLEIERKGNVLIYEMEFLRPDGRVIEYKLDAQSGRLLEQEVED